jgi:Fur family ferric uptake transcriptional regulator
MTRQRQLVLEAVSKAGRHPTADEVYARVRRRLPHISLGTVYRNLEVMAAQGLIQKLEVGGTQKRYDALTDGHCHVRCLGCGRVEDAGADRVGDVEAKAAEAAGYEVTGHRVEFIGYCPRCRKRRGAAGPQTV